MTATREVKIVIKTDLANSATALKQFENSFNSLGTTIKNVEVKAAGSLNGIKQAFHTVTIETSKTVNQINKQVNSMFDNAGESAVASIGVKVKSKSKQLRDQLRSEMDELRDIANQAVKNLSTADGMRIRENKTVADSISGIERKLANDIANIHAELNKTIDKILADRQRKIISQANATTKMQQAIQNAGIASNTSFSSADAAKNAYRQQRAIAEAEKLAYRERLFRYDTFQAAIAEQVNRTAELERLSISSNGGRIAVIRQQQAYAEMDMQRNLQREISTLRQRAAEGHITESDALGQTRNAYSRYSEQLQITRNNMEGLISSMQPSRFMQMVSVVGSLVSVSRLVNAAITTTITLLRSIPQAGIEMQSTISALHASMSMNIAGGSPDSGRGQRLTADAMEMLRKEADRTGISIMTLEKNYRTFSASAIMSGENISDVNEIFKGMNTTIAALHMTGDRAELTFLALSQMFNKGKIQSEELVKQLGNLLPGAFAAFARANGKTTEQLVAQMKAGTVRAHETIKNFITQYARDYSDAFKLASTGLNAELGRMESAWTDLSRAIFVATSDMMTSTVRGFTSILKAITPTTEGMHNFGILIDDAKAVAAGAAIGIGVSMRGAITALAGTLASTLPAFIAHPLFMPAVAIGAATAAIYKLQTAINTVDFSKLSPQEQSTSIVRQIAEKNDQLRIFDSMSAPEQFVLSKIVDIEKLRKERDNLMYSMKALKDDAAELQRMKDAAGIDFSEQAYKDIEEVRKALHPAVVEYEHAIAQFEAIRERQRKLTTHEADGYVVPGAKGMDRNEGEARLKQINDKLFADIDKENQDANKTLLDTLKKRSDAIKAELETSISQIDEKLSEEKDLYSSYNTDLQQVYDEGLIGLNTFYKAKLATLDQEYALTKQALLEKTQLYTNHLEQERSLIQQEAELKKAKAAVQSTAEEIKAIKPVIDNDSPLISDGMFVKVDKAWAKYKDYIEASAKRNKVDPALILAVMKGESAFNSGAVSNKNAIGLMQTIPATFERMLPGKSAAQYAKDPESNIEAGTRYLKFLLNRFKGSIPNTLAGYNAGEGAVDKYNGVPPYKETQNYVKVVMANREKFASYIKTSASEMKQSMQQMEVPKQIANSHTAMADVVEDSSTRIANASKKITASRTEEKQAEAEYLNKQKAIYHDYAMLVNAVHQQVMTPTEKFEQRKEELDQLREGIEGSVKLTEVDYVRALKLAQDELDKTLEKEQKRLTVNSQTESILKELNKNTRRELMDDRSNYLESAREHVTEYAIEHKLAMDSVERDMQRVSEAYDNFVKAQQQGAVIGVIKTGFNGLFKDLIKGTRSFTESFTELFDNAINQIIDISLQNLWNGFQKVFSGVSSGWDDIFSSVVQLGIAGVKHLISNSSKPSASSSETFAGETTGLSKFRYADTFGREVGATYRTGTEQRYADSLNKMASLAYDNSTSIMGYLSSLTSQIQNTTVGGAISGVISPLKDSLYNTFQPAVDFIKQGWDKVTGMFTTAIPAATSSASLASLLAGSVNGNFSPVANAVNIPMQNNFVYNSLGMSGYQLGDLPYSPTPTTTGANAAANGSSSIASKVTVALAVMKAGYEIISTALDKQATLGTQIANSMYAVSDALLAINLPILLSPAFLAAIPGMIAATVTNTIGSVSDMIDGDWKRGLSSLFGGLVGRMIYAFMPQRSPNMWLNNFSPSQENLSQRVSISNGLYERGTNKGKFFGTDTALGSMELSYHEIPRKTDMEKVDAGFKQLLLMYKSTNATVAANLNEIDIYRGKGEATVDSYLTKLQTDRIAFKQELESMDVADITKDYYDSVSKWFRGIGTFAGVAFATIYDNMSKTFADISTDSSVFSANIAQVSAVLANQMKTLPIAVIDNLTKILKTPGVGGNPDDVLSELVNNLVSFEELFKFVSGSQIGATVSQTKVSEWIVSWSELGLEIKNAGNAWAAYLSLFKASVTEFNKDTFIASAENYYSGIKNKFVGMGYSDKQAVSLSNTSILGAQQLSEFGVSNTQLLTGGMVFAQRVAEMSKKSFTEATEAIDAAILTGTKEGVLNEKMTREAMTATLVRTKAIDAETAALANFDVNMAQNTKTLLANYSSYGYMLVGVGTTLDKLGLTVSDIPGQIDLLTASFGDMSSAVDAVRTSIENAFGTSAANQYTLNEQTAIQAGILAKHPTMGQIGIKAGMTSQEVDAILQQTFKDIPNYMDTLLPVLTSPAYLADFKTFSTAGNTISSIKNQTWKENAPPKNAFDPFVSGNTKTDTASSSSTDTTAAADEAKRAYESYMEAVVDVNKQLSELRMTDVQLSISGVNSEIQKLAETAAKAGQTISNLSELQNEKLRKLFLDWAKPLGDEFDTLRLSPIQKQLKDSSTWFSKLTKDLEDFASALGWDEEQITTAKNELSGLNKLKIEEQFKVYAEEFRDVGKGSMQKSIEGVIRWREQFLTAAADIATALQLPLDQVVDTIETISNSRYTAAISSAKNSLDSFKTSISDLVFSLHTTKIGSPTKQFELIEAKAYEVYNKAKTGDQKAMSQLPSIASSYISALEARYGTSSFGQERLNFVADSLEMFDFPSLEQVIQNASRDEILAIEKLPVNIGSILYGNKPAGTLTTDVGTAVTPYVVGKKNIREPDNSATYADVVAQLKIIAEKLDKVADNQVEQVGYLTESDENLNNKLISVIETLPDAGRSAPLPVTIKLN